MVLVAAFLCGDCVMTKHSVTEGGKMKVNGHSIVCISCDGKGLRNAGNPFDPWPEECVWCAGSGKNWQYQSGAIAKYLGGPLIGRATKEQG